MVEKGNYNKVNGISKIEVDDFYKNTEIVIAQGEVLEKSRDMVAEAYAQFMPDETRSKEEAYKDLCLEDTPGEDIIFSASYSGSENNYGGCDVLATAKLTVNSSQVEQPLEATELLEVRDKKTGEINWPHMENSFCKAEGSLIGEIGRLVVNPDLKKNLEVQNLAFREVVTSLLYYAQLQEISLIYAVMPIYVAKFSFEHGVRVSLVNNEKDILLRDSDKANKIRNKYPRYWLDLNPSLYLVDIESFNE